MHRAALAVLCILLASAFCWRGWAATDGYRVQFSPVTAGKALGSVLVLDVGSMSIRLPMQPPISVPTPQECQLRCAALPGCTGYTFCNSTTGCGTGCQAYVAQHPAIRPKPPPTEVATNPARGERGEQRRGDRSEQPQQQPAEDGGIPSIPVLGFGPFAPNTTSEGCNETVPDKWAFGTCTLLKASQPKQTAPSTEGLGWVSGWQTQAVPAACSGLSARACAACDATPDPASCRSCMLDKRAAAIIALIQLVADSVPTASAGSRVLDQCVTCAQLPTKELQQRCTACVLDSQPCSSCISFPGAQTQISIGVTGVCMDCVTTKGKRFAGTCLTCAATPNANKCIACLDQFYPKHICKTNEYRDCYKPDFDNPCATCQSGSPAAYDSCIACYARPASKQDCDSCNQMSAKGDPQQQCFTCSLQAQAQHSDAPGGCGLCFSHSRSPAALKQCLGCVASNKTGASVRQYCSLCSSSDLDDKQGNRCFACLAGAAASPACSSCSRAAMSDVAFNSCMACYGRPDNLPDCQDCATLEVAGASSQDASRGKCFDCVVASSLVVPRDAAFAPLGSCAACFTGVKDPAQCLSCNTSPDTSTAAKTWCSICASSASASSRAACVKCLQTNRLDASDKYQQTCKV